MRIPLKQYWDLLVHYLRPLWPKVLVLAGLLFGGIGVQLLSPQILRHFIDTAQSGGALRTLYLAALLFLGAGLIQQALSAATTYVGSDVGWRATNRLRSDLLLHVLRLDLSFHAHHTPGELIERIDGDVTRLANFFSQFVIRLLGGILLSCGVLILLLYEDWRIGLAVAAFVSIYLVVHVRGQRIALPSWHAERQASADLAGFLGERLSGIKDIRANGAVAYSVRRFDEVVRRAFQTVVKADILTDVGWSISNVTFAVGTVTAMALGAYLFQREDITIGTVYLIIHYLQMLQGPLNTIGREVEGMQRVRVSVERVKTLVDTQPRIQDGPGLPIPSGPLSVEFQNVSFAYPSGQPVLRDLSFRIEPGRTLGLMGRTGSGKTTISRLLFRFYEVSDGAIRLGGVDIRRARVFDLRRRVGLVTQEVQLVQATLRDNLTLFDSAVEETRLWEALEALGLGEWCRLLPGGLDTHLGPDGMGLSAGEAQLLALTRVFLKDPGLVILDEASSRLDPATERLLNRAMEGLLRNRTGVLIAHRLSTVRRVDEIMILEEGRIRELGAYDRLVADPYSVFYGLLRTGLEEVLA